MDSYLVSLPVPGKKGIKLCIKTLTLSLCSSTNEVIAEENPAYGVTLGPGPATTTEPPPTAPQPQEAEYELIPF